MPLSLEPAVSLNQLQLDVVVDRPRVAVIERTGASCAPEQADLHRELWRLGWEAVSVDPQISDSQFDPLAFRFVVNRLSATAYDVEAKEPVFPRAKAWLEEAEMALGPDRVWNGSSALCVDASKLRQQALFEQYGVGPETESFSSLEAITHAEGSQFADRPVFLKLVAGGSGKGTMPFASFAALKKAIRSREFPRVTSDEATYPVLEQASERLRRNLIELFPGEAPHTVIVQQAIACDPDVEVYQQFLRLQPRPPLDRSRWVLRVECWGGEVSFGAWMATTGTNYCHAQGCDSHRPQSVIRLADDAVPVPEEVAVKSGAIAKAAGMRLSGIEWIREKTANGEARWLAIDINGLSIMRTRYTGGVWELKNGSVVTQVGTPAGQFFPWQHLAEYLVRGSRDMQG